MMDKSLNIAIQLFVDQHVKKTGFAPTMGEINEFVESKVNIDNNAPKDKFDGLSSEQIYNLLNLLWSSSSLIEINKLSDDEFAQIPLFRQIERLVSLLQEKGSIKMTTTGSLPMSVVREVYSVGISNWYIEEHQTKRLTEAASASVQRTRIMLDIMKVVKVQKGVMTLTARGKKLIKERQQFFSELMYNFCFHFNWAYFDGYESEEMGRYGAGFSLAMVAKYGDDWRKSEFYAAKYIAAFPMRPLTDLRYSEEGVVENNCYYIRTFERFMLEFGLIEIKDERVKRQGYAFEYFDIIKHVKKSDLFDKMFTFKL